MNPGPTHPMVTQDHPTLLTQDQLDALERVYQSQMVSLILGHSDPIRAKSTLDVLGAHLRTGHRAPANIVAGATEIAQGILGLRRRT